jgi:hypothetical protein
MPPKLSRYRCAPYNRAFTGIGFPPGYWMCLSGGCGARPARYLRVQRRLLGLLCPAVMRTQRPGVPAAAALGLPATRLAVR